MSFSEKKEYWIWLQCIMGYASSRIKKVVDFFGTPEDVFKSSFKSKVESKLFTNLQLDKTNEYSISYCERLLYNAYELGQRVITLDDPEYPQKLRSIKNCPCVLYVKGKIPNVDEKISISVVGSRNATFYGLNTSFKFAYNLAKRDVVIVSGGARGIDIQAHKATLKVGGVGICVLACGCDYPYLESHKVTKDALAEKGAVLSEFMPGTPPRNVHFPIRNRIMSGLSNGVLLVEAAHKSGSIITVNYALEQGRDVFVIPGNVDSPFSKGANMLIKEGAKPVTNIDDILEEYKDGVNIEFANKASRRIHPEKYNPKQTFFEEKSSSESSTPDKEVKVEVDKELQDVYNVLSLEPKPLEMIVDKSSKSVRNVLSDLTQLELMGLVENLPGKKYKITSR